MANQNHDPIPQSPDPDDPWPDQIQALDARIWYLIKYLIPEEDQDEMNPVLEELSEIRDQIGRLEPDVQATSENAKALIDALTASKNDGNNVKN